MKEIFIQALLSSDLNTLKRFAMILARYVRNNIEDFHVAYLSDKQMKELNPLIREGIFNSLFAIANYDYDPMLKIL